MKTPTWDETVQVVLSVFCNTVNAIEFDFTKKGIKFRLPKIDLSLIGADLIHLK